MKRFLKSLHVLALLALAAAFFPNPAIGVTYEDNEELDLLDKIERRDRDDDHGGV